MALKAPMSIEDRTSFLLYKKKESSIHQGPHDKEPKSNNPSNKSNKRHTSNKKRKSNKSNTNNNDSKSNLNANGNDNDNDSGFENRVQRQQEQRTRGLKHHGHHGHHKHPHDQDDIDGLGGHDGHDELDGLDSLDSLDFNDCEANKEVFLDRNNENNENGHLVKETSQHTQHGMMIDAGSQGTRVHVYEFQSRKLATMEEIRLAVRGMKLSFPTTDTRWTNRLKPGLDTFAYIENETVRLQMVSTYLLPLFDFSKQVLSDKQQHFKEYPIYLKATGGLRALPRPYRIRLLRTVRKIMKNATYNPFYFEDEYARVISGEEEAIYGWTAVNFAKGALIRDTEGSGTVTQPALKTYGVLEMGGASAQIGFFEPNGDVMANLFKLQIGSAKHWNVYVHSFLYFGVNLAFDILNADLYTDAQKRLDSAHGDYSITLDPKSSSHAHLDVDADGLVSVYNPCLPGKSTYVFTSRVHVLPDGHLLPLSNPMNASEAQAKMYSARMVNNNATGDYATCTYHVHKQLRKDANAWCNFAHDNDCSFAGIYQPPLPISVPDDDDQDTDTDNTKYFGEFIATSNFYDIFEFLGLTTPEDDKELKGHASIKELMVRSKEICTMSLRDLQKYNSKLESPIKLLDDLVSMCFRSVFIGQFLVSGAGFPEAYNVTAIAVSNGQKLDWALGSMLYEINTLPWEFDYSHQGRLSLLTTNNVSFSKAFSTEKSNSNRAGIFEFFKGSLLGVNETDDRFQSWSLGKLAKTSLGLFVFFGLVVFAVTLLRSSFTMTSKDHTPQNDDDTAKHDELSLLLQSARDKSYNQCGKKHKTEENK